MGYPANSFSSELRPTLSVQNILLSLSEIQWSQNAEVLCIAKVTGSVLEMDEHV